MSEKAEYHKFLKALPSLLLFELLIIVVKRQRTKVFCKHNRISNLLDFSPNIFDFLLKFII